MWREKHTMINLTQSGARCFAKAKLWQTIGPHGFRCFVPFTIPLTVSGLTP